VATNTAPAAWWDEDPATVLTAVAVLDDIAQRIERARRGR